MSVFQYGSPIDTHSYFSDIPSFLLDSANSVTGHGRQASAVNEVAIRRAIDANATARASLWTMGTSHTSLDVVNIEYTAKSIGELISRIIYLINNNMLDDCGIRKVYETVREDLRLLEIFGRIFRSRSEGSQQVRERILDFAILNSEARLLEILLQDGKVALDPGLVEKAWMRGSVEIWVTVLECLGKTGLSQGKDICDFGPRFNRLLGIDKPYRISRKLRAMLQMRIINTEVLALYKDEKAGARIPGTILFLDALESDDRDMQRYLSGDCVEFQNPESFLKVLKGGNAYAIRIWIDHGTDVNIGLGSKLDGSAFSALEVVLEYQSGGWIRRPKDGLGCLNLLLDAGADINPAIPRKYGERISRYRRDNRRSLRWLQFRWCPTYKCVHVPSHDQSEKLGQKCQLAPRCQVGVCCDMKNCFGSEYSFKDKVIPVLILECLGTETGSHLFDWLVQRRKDIPNIEYVLLMTIGMEVPELQQLRATPGPQNLWAGVPSRSVNDRAFSLLVETYPERLQKTLQCDRLLQEAIYYRRAEITRFILKRRTENISHGIYTSMLETGVNEFMDLVPSRIPRPLVEIVQVESLTPLAAMKRLVDATMGLDGNRIQKLIREAFPKNLDTESAKEMDNLLHLIVLLIERLPDVPGVQFRAHMVENYEDLTKYLRQGGVLRAILSWLWRLEYWSCVLRKLVIFAIQELGYVGLCKLHPVICEVALGLPKSVYYGPDLDMAVFTDLNNAVSYISTLNLAKHRFVNKSFRELLLDIVAVGLRISIHHCIRLETFGKALQFMADAGISTTEGASPRITKEDTIFQKIPELNKIVTATLHYTIYNDFGHGTSSGSYFSGEIKMLSDKVEYLLSIGLKIDVRVSDGNAFALGFIERAIFLDLPKTGIPLVKKLIDYRVEVGKVSVKNPKYGDMTLLLFAVYRDHYELAELLLQHGAESSLEKDAFVGYNFINWGQVGKGPGPLEYSSDRTMHRDSIWGRCDKMNSVTPLQCAAALGNMGMVLLLLQHGASVNDTSRYGFTALDQAAGKGCLDIVDILLKLGATKKRFRAADIAERKGFSVIAKQIREFSAENGNLLTDPELSTSSGHRMGEAKEGVDHGPMEIDGGEDGYFSEGYLGILPD
ncbi:hypothetical protein ABW19_dt0207461 [Dactylella cylindrospora]|nr:hypothetical protein ABW19_dt0207461 [Dactylella cylindrospora]